MRLWWDKISSDCTRWNDISWVSIVFWGVVQRDKVISVCFRWDEISSAGIGLWGVVLGDKNTGETKTLEMVQVVKTHRMPYLYRSFSAKEPCNQWLLCGKRPATWGILCIIATLYQMETWEAGVISRQSIPILHFVGFEPIFGVWFVPIRVRYPALIKWYVRICNTGTLYQ